MTPVHIYNEYDANAAEWMRNLIANGEIPEGKVDERSIKELTGRDLGGVTQYHTFAGIGGWPLALRLAGWPVDREVWTGSCPCQPFSVAGTGKGTADERHLWPEFFRLIKECRPATIFGEQVGSKDGINWLDGVQADLEGEGYTCGAVIMGAHSVGAPHIRQRIYWVATLGGVADSKRLDGRSKQGQREPKGETGGKSAEDGGSTFGVGQDPLRLRRSGGDVRPKCGKGDGCEAEIEGHLPVGGVADAGRTTDERRGGPDKASGATGSLESEMGKQQRGGSPLGPGGALGGMVDGFGPGLEGHLGHGEDRDEPRRDGEIEARSVAPTSATDGVAYAHHSRCEGRIVGDDNGETGPRGEERSSVASYDSPWGDFNVVPCTDGKARRTGARVQPLAYGLPRGVGDGGTWRKGLARSASKARNGMLRGSGNAIVPALAAEFIRAFLECEK